MSEKKAQRKGQKKVWRKPEVKVIAAGAAQTHSGSLPDSAGSVGNHS